jgi:hypothetical protein
MFEQAFAEGWIVKKADGSHWLIDQAEHMKDKGWLYTLKGIGHDVGRFKRYYEDKMLSQVAVVADRNTEMGILLFATKPVQIYEMAKYRNRKKE